MLHPVTEGGVCMEITMNNKPTDAQIGLLWHTLGLRPELSR